MTLNRSRWLAMGAVAVLVGLLVLVGLPSPADLNPMVAYERIKLVWKKRTSREPIQISHMIVDPHAPDVVYASSHFYGMLRSDDRGRTWRFLARGLGTTDVYSMAVHPDQPGIVYAATTGAGIYRSVDGGATWVAVNTGLSDTHVEDLAFDPADPQTLYAATMREVFKSVDGGTTWAPAFAENRKVAEWEYMHTLTVARFPGDDRTVVFIGAPSGGFRRAEGDADWEPLAPRVDGQLLTVFRYDVRVDTLYAGSIGGQFFSSQDGGRTWTRLSTLPGVAKWLHRIVLHPTDPAIVFVGSKGHGVFRSQDRGASWEALNAGLDHKVVKALAVHPLAPDLVLVGTPAMIAASTDGGATWKTVPVELPHYDTVVGWLGYDVRAEGSAPPPPDVWEDRCNECHGWTDRSLNFYRRSYWRVSPSRRDWTDTLDRMAIMAKLTTEQRADVQAYLDRYYGVRSEAGGDER